MDIKDNMFVQLDHDPNIENLYNNPKNIKDFVFAN